MRAEKIIQRCILSMMLLTCTHPDIVFSQHTDTIYYQRLQNLIAPEQIPVHAGLYDSVCAKTNDHFSENKKIVNQFQEYRPEFVRQLQQARLPIIFEYIPLVISSMNLQYHGDYEKTGIWGIDRLTAIRYHLRIDSLVDERQDPQKATTVALKELKRLMQLYEGNAWETILAWCSSPINVNSSKIRLGLDNPSPWDLQNDPHAFPTDLLTSFLSWIYVCHYGPLSIQNKKVEKIACFDTECRKPVYTNDLLTILQIDGTLFAHYNPALIGQEIPLNYPLHLPEAKQRDFSALEDSLYRSYNNRHTADSIAKVQADSVAKAKTASSHAANQSEKKGSTITYIVKSGDVLGKIANKYHVSVADIKRWNHLKSDMIQIGQKLIIHQ